MTTTVGSKADAREHVRKMIQFLLSDPKRKLQQNMWFIAKGLKDLSAINVDQLMTINRLLKAGAYLDAALIAKPPRVRITLTEYVDSWNATLFHPEGEKLYSFSATEAGAAALATFASLYLVKNSVNERIGNG
jgi:hypothetical protein